MSLKAEIFPMNSLQEDPNLRGSSPMIIQLIDFSLDLVNGIKVIDNIVSDVTVEDVVGATVYMKSGDVKTDITGVSKIETSGTGLKITLASSLTSSTATKVGTIALLGRITPTVL